MDSAIWTSLELHLRTEEQHASGEEGPAHWISSGALGNDWLLGQYEVSADTELVLNQYYPMFKTTKSDFPRDPDRVSGWGIVYIDDITYTAGVCPTVDVCSFENKDICNWHAVGHGGLNWLRWRPDYGGVGPEHDHTYHSGPGHYMRLHHNEKGNEVKSSLLISPIVKQHEEDKCLKFYFEPTDDLPNKYSLNVYTRDPGQSLANKDPLLSVSHTVYDEWMPVLVPLEKATSEYEVHIKLSFVYLKYVCLDCVSRNSYVQCHGLVY